MWFWLLLQDQTSNACFIACFRALQFAAYVTQNDIVHH